MCIRKIFALLLILAFLPASWAATNPSVPLKSLSRLEGVRDNPLVGYGLVIGLSGSGDSSRNQDTVQSIANVLQNFNVNINPKDVNSRNVAAVMVTASLPAFARAGDKVDVTVSSLGDARSLVGGTLVLTPLRGPDQKIYALAQGSVSVGGFRYDMFGNVVQKNHPTAGLISSGATIEKNLPIKVIGQEGHLNLILNQADFTTAKRVQDAINKALGKQYAEAISASRVRVKVPNHARTRFVGFVSKLEGIQITPDSLPTVVVNERTGTIVAGGNVRLSHVTISQGDLQVSISTDFNVSQPMFVRQTGNGVRSVVTPSTQITAKESTARAVTLPAGATVADLVAALAKVKTSTRDIISILQSLKRAGSLHAKLITQ